MALFDFFKKNSSSKKIGVNLSDFKFLSNSHIRYQNSNQVGGNNIGAWRGIRIQDNISNGTNYTVTIYNMDGNHPVWGNNIQMAPKQMKVIENDSSKIKLRGYGQDKTGNSFADYGVTLHLKDNTIQRVSLHMFDRGVEISYFKASQKKKSQKGEQIPIPSTNLMEVLQMSEMINSTLSGNLRTLENIYSKFGNYSHPQICYSFGVGFLIKGNNQLAKEALLKGAHFGIQYPCQLYNNALVDSIGQCLAHLMTNFSTGDNKQALNVTELAYLYLSRCIELHPRESHDSYRTRAILFSDHENPTIVRSLIMANAGLSTMKEPYMIADYYFASQASGSPHRNAYESARQIHYHLDDISVGGKDADEYSLEDMAELGEKRHFLLFKRIEQKYKNGELDMSFNDLKSSIR